MKIAPLLVALAAVLLYAPRFAPAAPPAASPTLAAPLTVPATLTDNVLYVTLTLNGKPAKLALDTGATDNALSTQAIDRLGLRADHRRLGVGGGGKLVPLRSVDVARVALGAQPLGASRFFALKFPDSYDFDGILGVPFFLRYVVTLDYAGATVTVTPRETATPPANAAVLPITLKDRQPAFAGLYDGTPVRYFMDTGSADGVLFYPPFVREHDLVKRLKPNYPSALGNNLGMILQGNIARIPSVTVGDAATGFTFRGFEGDLLSVQKNSIFWSRDTAANVGGQIWRRFTVTLDFGAKKVYLEKNRLFDAPFPMIKGGYIGHIAQEAGNPPRFVVEEVLPNTPADEAGLRVGDEILSVNGSADNLAEALETRPKPAGTVLLLTVRPAKGGAERFVRLVLRDIL